MAGSLGFGRQYCIPKGKASAEYRFPQTVKHCVGLREPGSLDRVTTLKSATAHGPCFFYGVDATKKPTAAPLDADNTYRSTFLCPQEESNLRAFFRMSRSAFSLATSRLSRAISSCSGFIWPWPGKACCGSSANFFTQSRNCDGCTPKSCDA